MRLTSSNVVANPATSTLQADVTVQNLISLPIGTPDGSTVSGVRVFFHQLPTVTVGSGVVLVQNPDGLGTFTAANQPYFLYDEIVQPQGTSAVKTWKFTVPSTATTFVFSVYVAAALPVETGVLRWRRLDVPEIAGAYLEDVVAVSSNEVYVVGDQLLRWNGWAWSIVPKDPSDYYYAAAYDGAGTLYLVGQSVFFLPEPYGPDLAGIVIRMGKSVQQNNVQFLSQILTGVWADATSAFVIGYGTIARSTGGGPFQRMNSDNCNSDWFYHVWGSGPNDVFVVGDAGLCHFDGTAWSLMPGMDDIIDVHGTGPDNIWAVGGFTVLHYDGSEWTRVPTDNPVGRVWVAPNGVVYASGHTLMQYAGGSWRSYPGTSPVYRLHGLSEYEVYALGQGGAILLGQY